MNRLAIPGLLIWGQVLFAGGGDIAPAVAARAAIERVYYNHRTGSKPPFEKTLPRASLENLVRRDLHKEAVLHRAYGITITPALLNAEVERIDTTTRAPEMLAEIKAALGNDPVRFANAFAKPFLVERLLHDRFENDDALHAPARHECETVRNGLLAAQTRHASVAQLNAQLRQAASNFVTDTTWQLAVRPPEASDPAADEAEIKKPFGPNAQPLSPPSAPAKEHKFYFEELPPALQNVLRAQLRVAGDVSAVIETPNAFLLYLLTERTADTLSVAWRSFPKLSCEQWLGQQQE